MRWYQRFFQRGLTEKHLDAELRFHLEQRIADNIAAGMEPEEARRRARLEFGGLDQVKEECRDVGAARLLETLIHDFRFGLRQLRRNPGFTIVAVLTLALGIGANTAIFSLTYAVILRSLPVPNPGELVRYTFSESGASDLSLSGPAYDALRRHETVNRDILAWGQADLAVEENGAMTRASGALMTGNGFRVLELHPYLGRVFGDPDDVSGGGPNGYHALLGFSYWKQHFDSKKTALGQALSINGRSVRVIGVLPPGFGGLIVGERADIILPLSFQESIHAPTPGRHDPGYNWLTVIGRLKPGESLQSARANLQATAKIVREEADPSHRFMGGLQFHVESGRSGRSFLRADYSRPLLVLEILVGLLLLLCCANTALLVLARASGRFREFAVRSALGAARGRLLRQALTEVGLLAAAGLVGGIWLGWAAAQSLVAMLGGLGESPALDVTPRLAILAFAAATSLLSALVAGIWPALRVSRVDPALDLKQDDTRISRQLGAWIVPAQVAVSVTLLVAASLLGGTFLHLLLENSGFQTDGVVMANVDLSAAKLTGMQKAQDVSQIVEALEKAPGIVAAAVLSGFPIGNGWARAHYFSLGNHGEVHSDMQTWPEFVSPGYFAAMGTRIIEGRGPAPADQNGDVCVLSASAVAYFFPNEDALGRFVYSGGSDPANDGKDLDPKNACQVVGVAEDARFMSLREAPPRMLYRLAAGDHWGTSFAVRTSSTKIGAAALRKAVHDVVPTAVPPTIFTFNELVNSHLQQERMLMRLSLGFAGIALLLTALGLYGVLARSVTLRTREIGVRVALGARQTDMFALVIRQGLKLVLIGGAVGLAGSLAATRLLHTLLFGVSTTNPLMLVVALAVLVLVAFPACYIPARRATKVDPMVALRYE